MWTTPPVKEIYYICVKRYDNIDVISIRTGYVNKILHTFILRPAVQFTAPFLN